MQPLIFTYCFTMGGYNVFETFLEFFLHINVMMAESTVDHIEQNTQEFPEVNTLLNLFNN